MTRTGYAVRWRGWGWSARAFVGWVCGEQKARLLAGARVVAVPSRMETFGIVAVEALAAATPVVAFAITSLREVVPEGAGFAVPPFDVAAYAERLEQLCADCDMALAMGSMGRTFAAGYDWDVLAARQAEMYRMAAVEVMARWGPSTCRKGSPACSTTAPRPCSSPRTSTTRCSRAPRCRARDGGGRARHGRHAVLRGRATAAHPGPRGPSCASAGRTTPRRSSRNAAPRTSRCSTASGFGTCTSGIPDALFRRRRDPSGLLRRVGRVLPELDHRYPTFRFDIDLGRVSRGDRVLSIGVSLRRSPRAPGTRRCSRRSAWAATSTTCWRASVGEHLRAVLYADFPYTARDPHAEAAVAGELRPWAWTADLAAKAPVIAGYRTQVDALFPGGDIPLRPETYYAPGS